MVALGTARRLDASGGPVAVLEGGAVPLIDIRTVGETGSTNADLVAMARSGSVEEGVWLRADRQTAGRGRQGRSWVSPVGNFYASTLVRLRASDPAASTLGFVGAVALAEVVGRLLSGPLQECGVAEDEALAATPHPNSSPEGEGLKIKWPNDLLIDGAKVSGILLERADDAVVMGIGVNLAHHPDLPDRRTTSLVKHGVMIDPAAFAPLLAQGVAQWLERWRLDGFEPIRGEWLARAHPRGTPLRAALPDGTHVNGSFEDLDADGALILRLASGERRAIHAGDVFLV